MQLIRKILFYLFALFYIVFCPFLIMHAFGYIFRLNIEKGLVKTGLISIATMPTRATVFLEDRRFASVTPTVIRDLIPGKYKVQLILKEYLSWSEVIFVEAGKAAIRDKVIMIPGTWKPQVLLGGKFTSLMPVEETSILLLSRGSMLKDWVVYETRKNLSWPLVEHNSLLGRYSVNSIYKSKGSRFVLIQVSVDSRARYLWIGLREKDSKIHDVTHLIESPPDQAQWDPGEPDTIFVLHGATLQKINLSTGLRDHNFSENVKGYYVQDRLVYILEDSGTVRTMDYDKKLGGSVPMGLPLRLIFAADKGAFDIQPLTKDIFLLRGRQGELCISMPPYQLVRQGVKGTIFSSDARYALFWKQNRLGILDLSFVHHGYVKGISRWENAVSWEFRHLKEIRKVFFVHGDSHILFLDNDTLYLLAVSGDTPKASRRLFDVQGESDVFYSEYHGRVYYLDPAKGDLVFVEIIPQKELLNLAF